MEPTSPKIQSPPPSTTGSSLEVPIIDGNTTAYSGGDTCETHRDEDVTLPITSSGLASYEIEGKKNKIFCNKKDSVCKTEIIYVRPVVVSRSLPASALQLNVNNLNVASTKSSANNNRLSCHEQPTLKVKKSCCHNKGPIRRLFNKFSTCCKRCGSSGSLLN